VAIISSHLPLARVVLLVVVFCEGGGGGSRKGLMVLGRNPLVGEAFWGAGKGGIKRALIVIVGVVYSWWTLSPLPLVV